MPIGAYTTAPALAWSGWRLRVPGGPVGGQYHGYVASDDNTDTMGWPAGHDEIYRTMDNPQNLGIYPWHHWDHGWHGSPLQEGETVSDFVYRSPAEMRPRPNASGGVNVVRSVQQMRTPGYAVAPGNYKTLGQAVPPHLLSEQGVLAGNPDFRTNFRLPTGLTHSILETPIACPSWGCGSPRFPIIEYDGTASPAPAPTVRQPPPPIGPQPGNIVSAGCPVGQYQDGAGNCVADWRNPYPIMLPLDSAIAPAPSVPANTCQTGYVMTTNGSCVAPGAPTGTTGVCPTGYTTDQYGNCVVSGVAPSGAGLGDWLGSSTNIFGMNIPNGILAGGVLLFAMQFMRHK